MGSAFRGAFGHAMKTAGGCSIDQDCEKCPYLNGCFYYHVFETPKDDNSELIKKQNHYPHPFVLRTPDGALKTILADEDFYFELIVIGNKVVDWKKFINCFEFMGELGISSSRGKFLINEVNSISVNGDVNKIYENGDYLCESPYFIKSCDLFSNETVPHIDKIKLKFISPVRIKYDNKLVKNLNFAVIISNLVRRITYLNYFHNTRSKANIDFSKINELAAGVNLIEESFKPLSVERFSSRQNCRHELHSMTGHLVFSGNNIAKFYHLLKMGEYTHIGKSTSFGFGQYKVELL